VPVTRAAAPRGGDDPVASLRRPTMVAWSRTAGKNGSRVVEATLAAPVSPPADSVVGPEFASGGRSATERDASWTVPVGHRAAGGRPDRRDDSGQRHAAIRRSPFPRVAWDHGRGVRCGYGGDLRAGARGGHGRCRSGAHGYGGRPPDARRPTRCGPGSSQPVGLPLTRPTIAAPPGERGGPGASARAVNRTPRRPRSPPPTWGPAGRPRPPW